MSFELTKEYLEELKGFIDSGNQELLLKQIDELHEADIAEIIDELKLPEAQFLYRSLDEETAADVLVELEEDVREKLLDNLTSKEIAEQIDNLESDDAADVIAELPDEKQEEVIEQLEDDEQKSDIVDLLAYEEGTAGALMAKELIAVKNHWQVKDCISEIRKLSNEVEDIYAVYVTDNLDRLIGLAEIKNLLLTGEETKVGDVLNDEVISVSIDADSDDVARTMEKYDLVVLPVIDADRKLVGRITIDDVVDIIMEEAEKDYQLASGLAEDVESTDSIWMLTRARLPWLLIGMLGGILGAEVIGLFDLKNNFEMAFFIPLIAAMGGNVGVQSSAIIVQGLAGNSLGVDSLLKRLFKELGIALINGLVCGVIVFGAGLILGYSHTLSLTVSLSLITVVIFAALFGTFVPLTLDRFKIDPALATGPFITTMNDILGLFIYFIIGNMMMQ